MSTWSNQGDTIPVVIRADSPATEIFVIDGRFRLVVSGLGTLETELPPGLYKLKYKAGPAIAEEMLALKPGSPRLEIDGPRLELSTAVPIAGNRSAGAAFESEARELSKTTRLERGQGGELFVFVRDPDVSEPDNVAAGLTLHRISGEPLIDYADYANSDPAKLWAGCNISLEPGTYRLRLHTPSTGTLEQAVVVCQGWQTQLFLTRRNYGMQRAADLSNTSVLMTRPGEGFGSDRPQLRYTELARMGLASGRQVVSATDLHEMLWAKYENPMLGIYGAHLLLRAPTVKWDLLETVTKNLLRLVGNHPDVTTLLFPLAAAGRRLESLPKPLRSLPKRLDTPPMLRSSWQLLIDASANNPELVPIDSLNGRIADRLWGEGAWLVWQQPDESSKLVKVSRTSRRSVRQTLAQVAGLVADRDAFEAILQEGKLTGPEEDLLRYAYRAQQMQQATAATESAGVTLPDQADLARAFGLPYSVLQQRLAGLDNKVENLEKRGVVTRRSIQIGGDRAVIGSEAGGSIVTGSGNFITHHVEGDTAYVNVGGIDLPVRDHSRQSEQAKLDKAIKAQEALLGLDIEPDSVILERLEQLRQRRDALAGGTPATGGVTTEDSLQQGGEGAVIGSRAGGDIVTGDNNIISDSDEPEADDDE